MYFAGIPLNNSDIKHQPLLKQQLKATKTAQLCNHELNNNTKSNCIGMSTGNSCKQNH